MPASETTPGDPGPPERSRVGWIAYLRRGTFRGPWRYICQCGASETFTDHDLAHEALSAHFTEAHPIHNGNDGVDGAANP